MKDINLVPRRKRRTCYDRLRKRMIEARRLRSANPARSAALQLSALFASIFGRMPLPAPVAVASYIPPSYSPAYQQKREIAQRLGISPRYVDVVLSQGKVPYATLFEHIRQGGALRRDALSEIRKRVPEASRDWLDHIERSGLWSSLTQCHVRGDTEEDTDIRLLRSTLAWIEGKRKPAEKVPAPAEAEETLKPLPGSDDEERPDDDPFKP